LNNLKKSYFYLNSFCLLVYGYKKAVIYNLLDGDVFWLDDKASKILKYIKLPISDIIEKCKLTGINKETALNLFSELVELNIGTFSDKKLFVDNIHNNFKKDSYDKELVDLKRVSIRVTDKCGLDCFFCNTNQNTICFPCSRKSQKNDRIFSMRDLQDLIDDISQFNCPEVTFIGGDPLKENGNFMDVLKYTANRIPNTYVFTNLISLSDYQVKDICTLPNVQLIIPLFSPDEASFKSICRKDNVLERILTNISNLREKKVKMSILFFKTKRDFDNGFVSSLLKDQEDFSILSPTPLIKDINISKYSDGFIIEDEDSFVVDLNSFFENNIYNSCLGRRITVDLNGDVKPCLYSNISFGNIFEKRLNKILRSGVQDRLWHLKKDLIETCNGCEFRYCCKHDCIVAANNINGKINTKYPFCNYDPQDGDWKNKKGE